MTAEILSFKKRTRPGKKSQGLCQHGFHKWVICNDKQFDSRKGKLVTVYRCARCNAQKVKAH